MASINLCCLVLGHNVYALITSSTSMRSNLKKGAQPEGLVSYEQFAQAASRSPLIHGGSEAQGTTNDS